MDRITECSPPSISRMCQLISGEATILLNKTVGSVYCSMKISLLASIVFLSDRSLAKHCGYEDLHSLRLFNLCFLSWAMQSLHILWNCHRGPVDLQEAWRNWGWLFCSDWSRPKQKSGIALTGCTPHAPEPDSFWALASGPYYLSIGHVWMLLMHGGGEQFTYPLYCLAWEKYK